MNIARIENRLVVVSETVGVASYDFDFELHFASSHPYRFSATEPCVLRIGPIADYQAEYQEKLAIGLRLIHSPAQHQLASELEHWYPWLESSTPRTRIFEKLPSAGEIEADFGWPIFLKGSRQTSKHDPDLAIIRDRAHYQRAIHQYNDDPILHWQKPVVREFIELESVAGEVPGKIRPSAEYRSFWWFGDCVGWGCYWYQVAPYRSPDIEIGLALARKAAETLQVPFLVVDFARTAKGGWIVIECNDGQESGYAGISPRLLWEEVLCRIPTIGLSHGDHDAGG